MSGQYMTAHQVEKYMEWQMTVKQIPELKAEVKRLREQLVVAKDWVWVEGGHTFETSEDRLKHYKEYTGVD